jgi:hypothetical protein
MPYAPKQIMKLVKYGCVSQRPCKGVNYGCMGYQVSCTMFCACGGGYTCLNPFNTDEVVSEDVDTHDDQDEDVEDIRNDEEDCVK